MATQELRKRANWQTISGAKALGVEKLFQKALQEALDSVYPEQFVVERHPKELKEIYSTYSLPSAVLKKIYNIDMSEKKKNGKPKYQWGISMDFVIRSNRNGKALFGEIKRQNGWIETTNMKAGRGNAHERSCKYFTPGLMKVIRKAGGLSDEILPFWIVLQGIRAGTVRLLFGFRNIQKIIICGEIQMMLEICSTFLKITCYPIFCD